MPSESMLLVRRLNENMTFFTLMLLTLPLHRAAEGTEFEQWTVFNVVVLGVHGLDLSCKLLSVYHGILT